MSQAFKKVQLQQIAQRLALARTGVQTEASAPLVRGVFVRMAPGLGQYIDTNDPPVDHAAGLLLKLRAGKTSHRELFVVLCHVTPRTPVGVKRIDAMIAAEGGFRHGVAINEIQQSIMIPAVGAETDPHRPGRFEPRQLQELAFQELRQSRWMGKRDNDALFDLERRAAINESGQPMTLVRVVHDVAKANRSEGGPHFVSHGWILVGEGGELLGVRASDDTKTTRAMMERARLDLSFDRRSSRILLQVEAGVVKFVDDEVEARVQDFAPRPTLSEAPAPELDAESEEADEEAAVDAPRG